MAIERLANAYLPWQLGSKPLSNNSKPSWELTLERLANATSDRFAGIEEKLDELASHFGRIQDQLHALCEVISSNDMHMTLA